jgi:hypothetical protein
MMIRRLILKKNENSRFLGKLNLDPACVPAHFLSGFAKIVFILNRLIRAGSYGLKMPAKASPEFRRTLKKIFQ